MDDNVKKQAGSKAVSTKWKPGQSGNPVGRPVGSRTKFSEAMVADFLSDWHQHGTDVLERVRMTEPATYLRVAAVVPKQMDVSVEQKAGPLDSDTMRKIRRFVDLIPAGAGEDAVFEALELFMRSHFAKPIDA